MVATHIARFSIRLLSVATMAALVACSSTPLPSEPTQAPKTTATSQPTATTEPTEVTEPAATSQPTATTEPTEVTQPTAAPEPTAEKATSTQDPLIQRGKQAYDDFECYNCHKIAGEGAVKRHGPDLDSVGLLMSYDAIWAELLNPTASLSEGFEKEYDKVTMPDDFGERMSQSDLKAITAYIASLQSTEIQSPRPLFPGPEKPDKGEGPFYEIPPEYQRVVPREWWTDEAIIEEGKAIYEGQVNSEVVCAACHGVDGKPVLTGAADFTDIDFVESMGDVYWYWRIATGVPGTAMTPWEGKLTPEQIMKVMVYQNTFAYDGEPTDHEEMFYPPKAQR